MPHNFPMIPLTCVGQRYSPIAVGSRECDGLFPVVALQICIVRVFRFFTIAVMRLVVDDEDVLHAHQVRHYALEHLPFSLLRVQFLAAATLQKLPSTLGQVHALAELEGVVVGDNDLGPVYFVEQVAGNEFAAGVVAVGVVRLEDAQSIFDRQTGALPKSRG